MLATPKARESAGGTRAMGPTTPRSLLQWRVHAQLPALGHCPCTHNRIGGTDLIHAYGGANNDGGATLVAAAVGGTDRVECNLLIR
jgi:hypothetical protein